MLDAVGKENMIIFGLTADEVIQKRSRSDVPRAAIDASPELKSALEMISSGVFSPDDPNRYRDLIGGLYNLAEITFERREYKDAEAFLNRYMRVASPTVDSPRRRRLAFSRPHARDQPARQATCRLHRPGTQAMRFHDK